MLNQVSVEALHSATYVENYLDCVENLPDDLQRYLTRMRELDVKYRACLRDVETNLSNCMIVKEEANVVHTNKRTRAIVRIQQSLITAQELGDEKLQVVQLLQDLIDLKSRQLDHDHRTLVTHYGNGNSVKEESLSVEPASVKETAAGAVGSSAVQAGAGTNNGGSTPRAPASPPHNHDRDRDREKDRTGERSSKRARRSRNDAGGNECERSSGATDARGSGSDPRGAGGDREPPAPPPPPPPPPDPPQRGSTNNNSNKKTGTGKLGTGKKKKRKSRQSAQNSQRDETTPPPEEADPIDPDEPTYCLCDQISFGEMILCDNDLCPIEWFHFSCVSLTTKPKGKWFCPKCRGDRPNVMKPKSQFLRELVRYNKEKEEKA